jgi:phosphatidylserine/phosphatidylglycerophosphate/cardiolipin synthase-like enzyme
MAQSNKFVFYSRTEYFRQLAREANEAKQGERIAVQAMAFDPRDPLAYELTEALIAAAARGVRVVIAIDAFAFLMEWRPLRLGPLWSHQSMPEKLHEPFRLRWLLLQRLKAAGGEYAITNPPTRRFTVPQAGRSHIKAAVVQDKIYIGGHNLTDSDHIDIMTCWHEATAANWVYEFITALLTTPDVRTALKDQDQTISLQNNAVLLIDAGVPRQSIIRDTAFRWIDDAQEWIFLTCQYFPGGLLAQHLLAAHRRGVQVRIIYSPPTAHGPEAPAHYLYNLRERLRLPASFFAEQLPKHFPLLHAKLLATEQGAILGSHNYVGQGVRLGTAEIALLRPDPLFATEAAAALTEALDAHGEH